MEEILGTIIAFLLLTVAWTFTMWQRWERKASADEKKHEDYVSGLKQDISDLRKYRSSDKQRILDLAVELDNRHPSGSLQIVELGDGSFQLERWSREYPDHFLPGYNLYAWRFVQAFANKSEVAKFIKAQEAEKLRQEEEQKNAELRKTVPPVVYWPR